MDKLELSNNIYDRVRGKNMKKIKVALFIPTYNAGKQFEMVAKKINEQSDLVDYLYVIDSSSKDDTVKIAKSYGFNVDIIDSKNFGHGKTRTQAVKKLENFDYVIMMTQDVYLQSHAIENLINFIKNNSEMALAYGKQEVDLNKGTIFESYLRQFNYPKDNQIKTIEDQKKYGIKTVFSSDAFIIYNVKMLKEVNYFDVKLNFAEDMHIAYKLINKGYSLGYCADSKVYHSHNYKIKEEFERYKNIGTFHKKHKYIQEQFGSNDSEGVKLVLKEMKYLLTNGKVYLIPESLIRNIFKYLGYKSASTEN